MKKILIALGFAALSVNSLAAPEVGVSISVGQPGFYGRIDIGGAAAPAVLYPQPVVIVPPPAVVVDRRPIYLRVPPGQAKDWRRYCGRYNACGQPVYFVREDWYQQRYAPRDRREARPARGRDGGHDHRQDDRGRGHDKHDKHDDRGHGKGHDKRDHRH